VRIVATALPALSGWIGDRNLWHGCYSFNEARASCGCLVEDCWLSGVNFFPRLVSETSTAGWPHP